MKVIGKYGNGNYEVVMFSDGSKMRYNNLDYFTPEKPESIDLKISNRCFHGCPQCHENSTPSGKHGDILNLPFLDTMLPYSEVACGGGNVLLHPDLITFLHNLKERKLIANMTVNQTDFMQSCNFLKHLVDNKLIYGLGVSLTDASDEFIKAVKKFPNAVIHAINGLVTMDELKRLADNNLKILILGYKEFRRGKVLYDAIGQDIENKKSELYEALPEIVNDGWFDCVSFDNLAIEQLEPKRVMTDEEYDSFYMGNDGEFTMYVDAVERKFAKSSTSTERWDITDDIKDMFDRVRGVA